MKMLTSRRRRRGGPLPPDHLMRLGESRGAHSEAAVSVSRSPVQCILLPGSVCPSVCPCGSNVLLGEQRQVPLPPARGQPPLLVDFMSVLSPLPCSDYLRSDEMTEVMMNTPAMDEIGLSPRKDGLSYQIFPDPSDFDRYCKLKDRLPSIVVEPTEGDVESGELRWPPEEFLVQEEDEEENCEDAKKDSKEQ